MYNLGYLLSQQLFFSDEDEDFKHQVQELRDSMPFAVVGANAMVEDFWAL